MIDFRYHLVSIVSIFLALAVGILLGAGPLKGDLGTRLTEQITALRAEKAQLRTDLNAAQRDTSARDTFSAAVGPAIMKGRLTGRTVSLVTAPGVDADLVKDTTSSLVAAGAKVGSTVALTDAWADPAKRSARNTLANRLSALVNASVGVGSPDQLAGTVLTRAILAGTDRSTERLTASAAAALDALKAGDLVNVSPDQILPSSSVVFLAGPVKGSTLQDIEARLVAYVELARAFDAGGSGTVVAAKSTINEKIPPADLVAAVRKSSDAVKVVSTVDDGELPMGQSTLILALEEQYAGSAGQYGLSKDAKAVAPDTAVKP